MKTSVKHPFTPALESPTNGSDWPNPDGCQLIGDWEMHPAGLDPSQNKTEWQELLCAVLCTVV